MVDWMAKPCQQTPFLQVKCVRGGPPGRRGAGETRRGGEVLSPETGIPRTPKVHRLQSLEAVMLVGTVPSCIDPES
jgi:hypothetical protein